LTQIWAFQHEFSYLNKELSLNFKEFSYLNKELSLKTKERSLRLKE
jgi:hypothetical protein